jgi:hypothetical protein
MGCTNHVIFCKGVPPPSNIWRARGTSLSHAVQIYMYYASQIQSYTRRACV